VVMSVHNGCCYLAEAIESILVQTLKDFEFIIIDDGSTDGSTEVLKKYAGYDDRIRLIIQKNHGLPKALNIGLTVAHGKYIARMDADDWAVPHRLQVQLAFMESNPEITVCGSAIEIYEYPNKHWNPPCAHHEIMARMLFESCLYHPTVLYRKDDLLHYTQGYSEEFTKAQDYDLWQRLGRNSKVRFANLAEPLLRYRIHPEEGRSSYKWVQHKLADQVRKNYLLQLGIVPSKDEFKNHIVFCRSIENADVPDLDKCRQWLDCIEAANREKKVFSIASLRKELESRWLNLCLQVANDRVTTAILYIKGNLISRYSDGLYHATRMFWRWTKAHLS
ncbi:MAG: glycosyltransferase, partial [Ferruginibacter sp.]